MAKLKPLWTPGGARGSNRPPGLPSMVSPQPANAAIWFEDFFAFPSGTINYTDSGTDTLAYGQPSWVTTSIAGTGSVGAAGGNTGSIGMATGLISGDGLITETSGRTTAIAQGISHAATLNWNAMCRVNTGASGNTSCVQGIALISPQIAAVGADWLTDPDTLFTGLGPAIIIRRNTAAAGADAGDWIAKVWDSTGTVMGTVTLVDNPAANTTTKFEISHDKAAVLFRFYADGVLKGSIDATACSAGSVRFGCKTLTAASRGFSVDCWYQEVEQTTAR